jgi:hypothetical protein
MAKFIQLVVDRNNNLIALDDRGYVWSRAQGGESWGMLRGQLGDQDRDREGD